MSRLSRERLLIALAPRSLALLRIARAPRARVVATLASECEPRAGAAPWEPVVAALARLIAEQKDADATVVLSNHFVRYTLVPRNAALGGAEEQLAYARYCFAKVHGERSKAWEVRLGRDRGEPLRVASAVDAALLEAVRAGFPAQGGPRLVSVQPYLMAAFNRWRRLAGGRSVWLLLLEPGRACLAGLESSRWIALRNVIGDYASPARWHVLLDRERWLLAAPAAHSDVLVHAPAVRFEAVEREGWRFRPLGDPLAVDAAPRAQPLFAMALCAA
ncbi:MAG: hypothetical protein ACREVC_03480 [Burkholderiales bacterium]